jgi:hypothetical protein
MSHDPAPGGDTPIHSERAAGASRETLEPYDGPELTPLEWFEEFGENIDRQAQFHSDHPDGHPLHWTDCALDYFRHANWLSAKFRTDPPPRPPVAPPGLPADRAVGDWLTFTDYVNSLRAWARERILVIEQLGRLRTGGMTTTSARLILREDRLAGGTVTANGPGSRWRFFWDADAVSFEKAPLRYRLCAALWDTSRNAPHTERNEKSVVEAVYGSDKVEQLDENLKGIVKETNRAFTERGWNLKVKRQHGKIWLEVSP